MLKQGALLQYYLPGGKFLGLKIRSEYRRNANNAMKMNINIVTSSASFPGLILKAKLDKAIRGYDRCT